MQPKILYLLHARTGQSHTMCILSSLLYPHSRHSCPSMYPSLYKCALRLVWPVNSPTAVLSLNLFMARSSLALLGRGYLISTLDCRHPVQVVHLARRLCSNSFLLRVLPTLKAIAANWFGGTSIAPLCPDNLWKKSTNYGATTVGNGRQPLYQLCTKQSNDAACRKVIKSQGHSKIK
jgi:hypothetical protein